MTWALEPFEIRADDLLVRDLRESDVQVVSGALIDPEGWSGRTWGAGDAAGARKFVETRLASKARGESLPLVYFLDGAVAGVSGLHGACERRKAIEIGFTSVVPGLRRTAVNTRVKALLLRRCFDTLKAVRVEFRVDARNYVSQMAVLRLGGRFDGRIDHWVVREGDPHPVGHIYSITIDRWAFVQERLTALREGRPPADRFLPHGIYGPRVRLELSRLADAPELLELARRDPANVALNFPQLACLQTPDDAKAYIAVRAHAAAEGAGFHYVVRDQTYGGLVGHVQVKKVDWRHGSCELGYLLAPGSRGKGYGTEMLARLLRELKALSRVTVRVLPENTASLALARKLGFEEEGLLRSEHVTSAGERRDVILLGLAQTRPQRSSGWLSSSSVSEKPGTNVFTK